MQGGCRQAHERVALLVWYVCASAAVLRLRGEQEMKRSVENIVSFAQSYQRSVLLELNLPVPGEELMTAPCHLFADHLLRRWTV